MDLYATLKCTELTKRFFCLVFGQFRPKKGSEMAKPYRLRDLESQYGDLNKIIPPLVNLGGQKYAATQLTCSVATISTWLKDNGYVGKTTYVREEPPQDDQAVALKVIQEQLEAFGFGEGVTIEIGGELA
jgi:hypothetical protein